MNIQSQTLGQIAAQQPASIRIFLRNKIDFCCGGGRLFQEACQEAGLDPDTIEKEIETENNRWQQSLERWDNKNVNEIIDHIINRYHIPLKKDLPALIEAAMKVERVHQEKGACPHGLAQLLQTIHLAVLDHLEKEEKILFPMLKAGAGNGAQMPIRVMMQEHEDHGENLKKIRKLTNDLQIPPEACATWKGLYQTLEQFEAELMEHIHLENNVLFPKVLAV